MGASLYREWRRKRFSACLFRCFVCSGGSGLKVDFTISEAGVRGILLDIEGTTTPISFVYDVLFPFARTRLQSYIAAHAYEPDIQTVLEDLRREHAGEPADATLPGWSDPPLAYLRW